jgi:hypothetical protein
MKQKLIRIVGYVLLVASGVALYYGENNFVLRFVGIVALLVSVRLFNRINVRTQFSSPASTVNSAVENSGIGFRPRKLLVAIILIVFQVIATVFLYRCPHNGFAGIAAVYVFAAISIINAAY